MILFLPIRLYRLESKKMFRRIRLFLPNFVWHSKGSRLLKNLTFFCRNFEFEEKQMKDFHKNSRRISPDNEIPQGPPSPSHPHKVHLAPMGRYNYPKGGMLELEIDKKNLGKVRKKDIKRSGREFSKFIFGLLPKQPYSWIKYIKTFFCLIYDVKLELPISSNTLVLKFYTSMRI